MFDTGSKSPEREGGANNDPYAMGVAMKSLVYSLRENAAQHHIKNKKPVW